SGNDAIRKVVNGVITTAGSLKRPTGVAVDFYGHVYAAGSESVGPLGGASFTSGAGANDIAVDLVGNAAFVTGTEVARADTSGNVTVAAGGTGPQSGTTGSSAPALMQPVGLAMDAAGDVYIADAKANVIWQLSAAGKQALALGNGDAKTMSAPNSVAVDAQGNVYVADTGNNRVLTAAAGGKLTTLVDQLNAPSYVFADAQGLLVADTGNNRVLVI